MQVQKYRSHRKHLMAREAEAASWTQKRQMYAAAAGGPRKDAAAAGGAPWVVPTIGFPPPGTMPHAAAMAHHPGQPPPFCRPLHVWGHPTGVDAPPPPSPSMLPVWPRHLAPPPAWAHQPPVDPAYWHQQYNVRVPHCPSELDLLLSPSRDPLRSCFAYMFGGMHA